MNTGKLIQKIVNERNIFEDYSSIVDIHKQADILNLISNEDIAKILKDKSLNSVSILKEPTSDKEFIDKELPPFEWHIEHFIPKLHISALTAPPGTYKTWLALDMALSIASGKMFLGEYEVKQGRVLYVNEELNENLMQMRRKAMNYEASDNIFFYNYAGVKLDKDICEELINICRKNKIEIIIFDSFIRIHGYDENSSTEMKEVQTIFKEQFLKNGISILFTHHHRKSNGFTDPNAKSDAMRGSTEILAMIHNHITMERKDDFIIITEAKTNCDADPIEPVKIKMENNNGKINWNFIGEYKNENYVNQTICDAVMIYLTMEDYKTIDEIAAAMKDYGKLGTIRENVKFLENENKISSTRKGTVGGKKTYFIPKEQSLI